MQSNPIVHKAGNRERMYAIPPRKYLHAARNAAHIPLMRIKAHHAAQPHAGRSGWIVERMRQGPFPETEALQSWDGQLASEREKQVFPIIHIQFNI